MSNLTKQQVYELARLAGLELDDQRAETIASRLGAVLEELDEIPADALAAVEPALTFTVTMQYVATPGGEDTLQNHHVERPAGGTTLQNREAQNG